MANLKHALLYPNALSLGAKGLSEVAVEAEKAGWDGFFMWDNLAGVDTTISLAAIAMNTSKINIGPMVTAVARRRPWKLAQECKTLDNLSNGRLIFGAGLGDESEYVQYGESGNAIERAQKLDEGLEIMAGIWTGEKFGYEGKHYKLKEVKHSKPARENRIPIWTGGLWPNKVPFRRAAKWDGIMPHTVRSSTLGEQLTHEEVKDFMKYIEKHRQGSMDDFSLVMLSCTPPEKEKAIEIINPFVELGAKWWCESVFEWQIPLNQALERVKQGPPSI